MQQFTHSVARNLDTGEDITTFGFDQVEPNPELELRDRLANANSLLAELLVAPEPSCSLLQRVRDHLEACR
jgi:hypothetical protein